MRTTFTLAGTLLLVFSGCLFPPAIDSDTAEEEMQAAFVRRIEDEATQASMLVYSEELGLNLLVRADPHAPDAFHVASVGKLFTARRSSACLSTREP